MTKIAIDIGNVIFQGPYCALVLDALQSLEKLAQTYELYLLSSCSLSTEDKCREHLVLNGIELIIPPAQWIFVRTPKDKITKMKKHDIAILIDDKIETIQYCNKTVGKKSGIMFTNWKNVMLKLR